MLLIDFRNKNLIKHELKIMTFFTLGIIQWFDIRNTHACKYYIIRPIVVIYKQKVQISYSNNFQKHICLSLDW